jgi:hypothetical protein
MNTDWLPMARWCRTVRDVLSAGAQHQADVIQVLAVLPGSYRYTAVESAIRASGASALGIYRALAAGTRSEALDRFYEALNGPNSSIVERIQPAHDNE